ncbi:hypothetical protein A3C57_03185 [Candidatus Nomurabacteria bacterium RIFCSPHIGHO2_02_FULL_33_12]|uniref:AbiEi antitoxin C-terminal domain-containing protein n=1 Tax=Candidatus Nomurabacteria bacterium RIFCSPLOWO2_01_FULL_33_17 TaxID=1801764 RepID=A0A1F6WPH8_9BACT|nr:MAG: hypothetical protein A3C57_03185 [Candidatus Nomurabacteria bacterium RIFCSPHIGHO2_02_FULL_33_12]OGI83783.1 MAG: hypothetical protein A2903_01100 [Candidatus Nomurabacteria bacterium RIFCSPLOWO2_01_FULL_33_17]
MNKKPIKGEYLEILLRSPKTVFSTKDIALLWGENRKSIISGRLNKYAKIGKLFQIHRGLYAKDKKYILRELATSIYTPSYISFETVLKDAGIIFQHYDTIFIAGKISKNITIDKNRITFRKLKDIVLFNSAGIDNNGIYSIASKERAFLDMIYIFPKYYFDNLRPINWDKCFELAKLYNNKQLIKRLIKYKNNYVR